MPLKLTPKDPSSKRNPSTASTSQTLLAPKLSAVPVATQLRKSFGCAATERPLAMCLVCVRYCPMAIWTSHRSAPRTIVRRCTLRFTPVWPKTSLDRSFREMSTCEPVRHIRWINAPYGRQFIIYLLLFQGVVEYLWVTPNLLDSVSCNLSYWDFADDFNDLIMLVQYRVGGDDSFVLCVCLIDLRRHTFRWIHPLCVMSVWIRLIF